MDLRIRCVLCCGLKKPEKRHRSSSANALDHLCVPSSRPAGLLPTCKPDTFSSRRILTTKRHIHARLLHCVIVRVGRNLTWPRLAAGFCRFRYSRYSSRSQQASPRAASMCVGRILRLSPCQVNGRCPGRVFLGLGAFFLGAGNGCFFATLPYHNIGTQAPSTRCFPPLCPCPVR